MIEPKIPENEDARIKSLHSLNILDTPVEERFDRICQIAQKLFNVPISVVSLVDINREWFKSCTGLDEREGPRNISFCGHTILTDDMLIIEDARLDGRFVDNPTVKGEPFLRFYAGQPIYGPDNQRIGAFCLKDQKPRKMTPEEIKMLKDLAKWVELELNYEDLGKVMDSRTKALNDTIQQKEELEKVNRLMVNRELKMVELKNEIEKLKSQLSK